MPKFSIIIPVYKVEDYLECCLDSVLAQSYADYQVICVDDGSPDACGKMLDTYAKGRNNWIVIHQENGGLSMARNAGLDVATGEYVCFLDSDDKVADDWLSVIAGFIDAHHPDMVHINHCDWFEDGEVRHYPQVGYDLILTDQVDLSNWAWKFFPSQCFAQMNVLRRDILNDCRFVPGVLYEDMLFTMSILPRLKSLCSTSYDGYYYRQRSDSIVRQKYDYRERKRFVDAWKKVRAETVGKMTENDVRRAAMEAGEQEVLISSFFAWLSRPACTIKPGCGLEELHGLAKMIDYKQVKRRWRMLFWVFQKTGFLFPLRELHDLAMRVAGRRS